MYRPRVIPVLLLKKNYLVKTTQFKNPQYIGDPINAVKIFNDLRADELVLLDIEATHNKKVIDIDLIKMIGEEANMPFSVGGGINSLDDIRKIIAAGAERVIIGTQAILNQQFVKDAAQAFGSSTISVCMDVKKNFFNQYHLYSAGGTRKHSWNPIDFACKMEDCGVGELIVQSIDKDGTMKGYDLKILNQISSTVSIPIVALGGAGTYQDLSRCYKSTSLSGVAAGSIFVFYNEKKSVLINYPENKAQLFTH